MTQREEVFLLVLEMMLKEHPEKISYAKDETFISIGERASAIADLLYGGKK